MFTIRGNLDSEDQDESVEEAAVVMSPVPNNSGGPAESQHKTVEQEKTKQTWPKK